MMAVAIATDLANTDRYCRFAPKSVALGATDHETAGANPRFVRAKYAKKQRPHIYKERITRHSEKAWLHAVYTHSYITRSQIR